MKKRLSFILLFLSSSLCFAQTKVLKEIKGDLNQDGIKDRVVWSSLEKNGEIKSSTIIYITDGPTIDISNLSCIVCETEDAYVMGKPDWIIKGKLLLYYSGGKRIRYNYTLSLSVKGNKIILEELTGARNDSYMPGYHETYKIKYQREDLLYFKKNKLTPDYIVNM